MNDTAHPPAISRRLQLLSYLVCVIAAALCFLFAGISYFGTSRFIELYEDFDEVLPTLKLLALKLHIPLVVVLVITPPILFIKEWLLGRRPETALVLNVITTVLISVMMAVYSLSIVIPYFRLVHSLI